MAPALNMKTFLLICITLVACLVAGLGSGGFYYLAIFWLYFIVTLSLLTWFGAMASDTVEQIIRKEYSRDTLRTDMMLLSVDIAIIAWLVFSGFVLLPILWLVSVFLIQALKKDWREQRRQKAFKNLLGGKS